MGIEAEPLIHAHVQIVGHRAFTQHEHVHGIARSKMPVQRTVVRSQYFGCFVEPITASTEPPAKAATSFTMVSS